MAHLVFQTAYPGDLFLSIPLLKRVRAWDPGQRLVLACRPSLGAFFLRHKLVDEVIEIDKKTKAGRAAALKALRREDWDYIFVPHTSVRTAWWMRSLRARQGKVSFAKWWNRFVFKYRVERPDAYPDALRQLSLMTAIDADLAEWFAEPAVSALKSPITQTSPVRFAKPVIPEWASMQVLPHRPVGRRILLAPGSVWGTKRWTKEGYAELAALLISRKFTVELVGSPKERALGDEIAALVPGVLNRVGQTKLVDLAEDFAGASALICNDSGAMHVASTVGLPTVAIFGPTTLDLGYRPWNNRAIVVQRELPCRPCGKHGPQVCPIGTHACMKEISAHDVMRALIRLRI